MNFDLPVHLATWLSEHRGSIRGRIQTLRLGNGGAVLMAVGGPNATLSAYFHLNPTEELFLQLEGDIALWIEEEGAIREVLIREGELYLLPANVWHAPRRPADTVGLVFEQIRPPGVPDQMRWDCTNCGETLHRESFVVEDLPADVRAAVGRFCASPSYRSCPRCGRSSEETR